MQLGRPSSNSVEEPGRENSTVGLEGRCDLRDQDVAGTKAGVARGDLSPRAEAGCVERGARPDGLERQERHRRVILELIELPRAWVHLGYVPQSDGPGHVVTSWRSRW